MLKHLFNSVGYARLVAFGLILLACYVRILDPIPIKIARDLTFDFYQRIEPRTYQDLPVAIIDVDDASITELGQWPWPRTVFAEMVDKLTAAGVRAIAFDIVFAEPDRLSPAAVANDNDKLPQLAAQALRALPDNDDQLALAFARSTVIAGQTNIRYAATEALSEQELITVPYGQKGPDTTRFIMRFPEIIQNLPQLEAAAAGRGMFSILPGVDGVYRNTPLVMEAQGKIRLSLAAEMVRVVAGNQPFILHTNEAGISGVTLARQLFETNSDGTVRPYLTETMPERYIPAADVITGRIDPERLQGKLVFVGTSAVGLQDIRATPFGVRVPGVEFHAQLLENLLIGSVLKRPNDAIALELAVTSVLCLLVVILSPIMNATILALSSVFILSAMGVGSFLTFQTQKLLIDPSFPILAGLATIIFMTITNYLREENKRREIRSAFGQYVSSDLVDTLADNPEGLRLGGETRDLTLLFSDVRGFTSIAESFREDPQGLTLLMNRLLNTLSDAILQQKGTIDKFMGDAVMAFWNAPIAHKDHARSACYAALAMKDNIDALNAARKTENGTDYQELRIGIGIATGSCLVGNMGSDQRFDYTAMGDPVNLASRLEGQSSFYGQTIVAGPLTEELVRDEFAMLELDIVRLKGKKQSAQIYTLIGEKAVLSDKHFKALKALNAEMLTAYRTQAWGKAQQLISNMRLVAGQMDLDLNTYLNIYLDRIAAYSNSDLPTDWDGVHDATSK
ncbi:MAG: CHASE2 domain-containing protein [Paracoccaceae bacterium]